MRRSAGLLLVTFASHIAFAAPPAWQWRGPDPLQAAADCTERVGARDPSATTYVTSSKDGSYIRARSYYDDGSSGWNEIDARCMRKSGYVLDESIAEPVLNPDYVRAYFEHTGIKLETAEERAAREESEREEAARKEAEEQAKEAARNTPEALAAEAAKRDEMATHCKSMTTKERQAPMGKRLCPGR